MIQTLLQCAMVALGVGDAPDAINYLSEARALARKGDTIRCKLIAIQCTAAIQALLPEAVGYRMFQMEHEVCHAHA